MTTLIRAAGRVVAALSVAALCACTPASPAVSIAPTLAPTLAPSASPRPSVSPTPLPSPVSPAGPALTETFVSAVHGITASHPSGWSVQAATEPWTTDMLPLFREPFGDFIYDPQLTDHLFLGITSKPLSGGSVDEWMAPVLSDHGCGSTEPVTIDGASGLISPACLIAAVSAEDRGYVILLYVSGDEPRLKDVYNLALFKQILATVQLDPGAAAS